MDILFRDGKIWVKQGQWAEAVAVRGQRILAVGTEDQVRSAIVSPFRTVDMDNGMLMPGFHDGHLHLLIGGFSLFRLSLDGITDRDRALAVIRKKAIEIEKLDDHDPWLLGIGYDINRLRLTIAELNEACPTVPSMIRTRDLHSAMVNRLALERASITSETPDPLEGAIEHDEHGQPTGVLKETAVDLVDSLIPLPGEKLSMQAMNRAQQEAFRFGITSVSDSIRSKNLPFYETFHTSDQRKIRINGWRVLDNWSLEGVPPNPKGDIGFQVRTVKGFVDGAMGSDTAWLLEDFTHRPGYRGIGMIEEDHLTEVVREAVGLGYWVTMHAIGDRANRVVLNAYERVGGNRLRQFRIEHAQLLSPEDILRFAQLGVIASMQPIHCTDDMSWKIRKVGEERVKSAYPWNSMLKQGATIIFGTDWPVADLNPMQGLRAAVTRQAPDGTPKDGWNKSEAISLEKAMDLYTRTGAFGAAWDSEVGTLEIGKRADMILLSRNLFETHPLEFVNVKVNQTWIDGEVVFER
jgi:predicted amidohydrolase YtcJ